MPIRAGRRAVLAGVGVAGFVFMAGPSVNPAEARTIRFSGRSWEVKTSTGRVGPGPNYFSDSAENVRVDAEGRLHLRITRRNGRWHCAEVVSRESFGFGTYRFTLDSPVDALDPNAVLGLFTWSDAPAYHHREIDIEFARWGQADNRNAQYVVQPHTRPENIFRWSMPAGVPTSSHSFFWKAESILFQSWRGSDAAPPSSADLLQHATLVRDVPRPGGENARMNLWLFNGKAPATGTVEVIVKRFEFVRA